ncbi:MAG: TonB family protein [Paracoccus sp. (in: a-proteobacteria)]|uniref:energy transducer TonB family protein n=1 Tax=Paracoccus sp. TaxID=267 RepID=UPI0039E2331A
MSRRQGLMREGALWGSAAVLALAAHLGGAIWLMRTAEAAAPPGLPEPVFVELAPMPEAAAPPDEIETPEVEEAEPEPVPDLALDEPLPVPEPIPDMDSLFPPPPDAVVIQKSERPQERPEPEPEPKQVRKEPEKKPEPKKKAPEEQPQRKAQTTVRAAQSDRSAAPAQGAQPSPKQVASWQSRVQAAVARHMQRARVSGRRGAAMQVTVTFTLGGNGAVTGARLLGSTGDAQLDAMLNRQASRMPRLPSHPSGKSVPLTLPVRITF